MKVATIEYIKDIQPHPNADKMDIAIVKGWKVCIKKNEYKIGDLCIYVNTDTELKECSQYEFLRNKNFRIKPIKLRGQLSEGIIFPISLLKEFGHDVIVLNENVEGTDVSEFIGAKHYEKPIPTNLAGKIIGHLPSFIKKTDEENLENVIGVLNELKNKPYYITVKVDGSSGTFYINNGKYGVCSRNLELLEEEKNGFFRVSKKYDIENKLKAYFKDKNVAIQGEVYGPGIQNNLLDVREISFCVFNLWDIDNRKYFDYVDIKNFCVSTQIPMVDVIKEGDSFDLSFEELQSISNKLKYASGNVAEGIVVRPKTMFHSNEMKSHCSFKVKNEEYKLKYE
jgi:RNA ligase (TIGR02306 family)